MSNDTLSIRPLVNAINSANAIATRDARGKPFSTYTAPDRRGFWRLHIVKTRLENKMGKLVQTPVDTTDKARSYFALPYSKGNLIGVASIPVGVDENGNALPPQLDDVRAFFRELGVPDTKSMGANELADCATEIFGADSDLETVAHGVIEYAI